MGHILFTHGWLQVSYAVTFTTEQRHLGKIIRDKQTQKYQMNK